MSVNRVTLLGNTGKEVEFKEFEGGGCVASVSLATTKKGYKKQDGTEVPEKTEWHNIILRGSLAKVAKQYVKKGDKLYVEGELQYRQYQDKEGATRFITEIVVTSMEMLTPKAKGNDAPLPSEDDYPF